MKKLFAVCLAVLLLLAALPLSASAQDISTGTLDGLKAALAMPPSSGDTITLTGNITLDSDITVPDGVEIVVPTGKMLDLKGYSVYGKVHLTGGMLIALLLSISSAPTTVFSTTNGVLQDIKQSGSALDITLYSGVLTSLSVGNSNSTLTLRIAQGAE